MTRYLVFHEHAFLGRRCGSNVDFLLKPYPMVLYFWKAAGHVKSASTLEG